MRMGHNLNFETFQISDAYPADTIRIVTDSADDIRTNYGQNG